MNNILSCAHHAWTAGGTFRARRLRYKRYTYGDQWSDPIPYDGTTIPEHEAITRSGRRPLVNNLIRQLVKSVVGHFRNQTAEQGLYKGPIAPHAERNALPELDSRLLEEFLISGCAIQRVVNERRFDGADIWVDNVDPRRFFVNPFRDPRGRDIDLIGMLHDMTFPEVVNRFARGSKARAEQFRRIYDPAAAPAFTSDIFAGPDSDGDFFHCPDPARCRVIEVWTLDSRPRRGGVDHDFVWHARFLAPDGTLLGEYDSPYAHRSHPFVVKLYPLTDGEVHSFVEDIIEQQRFINRLIVQIDHIMSCSAKGVLLFPVDQLVSGASWDDVARKWAQCDSIIPITGNGDLPRQVVSNTANTGAYQLLQLELNLFEQTSGVGDALMGRLSGHQGAELYQNQVRNATIALADIFESFRAFLTSRDAKLLRTKLPTRQS